MWRAELHDCGHPLSETTDPRNESRYKAGLPIRCHACHAIEVAQTAEKREHPRALIWQAELR